MVVVTKKESTLNSIWQLINSELWGIDLQASYFVDQKQQL